MFAHLSRTAVGVVFFFSTMLHVNAATYWPEYVMFQKSVAEQLKNIQIYCKYIALNYAVLWK